MPSIVIRRRLPAGLATALIALAAIAAATASPAASAAKPNAYTSHNLVSDGAVQADHTDVHLKNGWGVAFNPQGFVWVANNGTGTSTLYDGNGNPNPLVVNIPMANGTGNGTPTGIVFNGTATDFIVTVGAKHGSAAFIFASEDGAITGWASAVDGTHAIVTVTPGADAPVYKGLAIASNGAGNHLYAADFKHARIDVFDKNWQPAVAPGGFIDPNLPTGYAPFNIQAIKGTLVVAYAKQKSGSTDEQDGPGLGFIDQFDTDGHLLHRAVSHKGLNAPWGLALAPSNFGAFSNALLVGNFGDGTISAYSTTTGAMLGTLKKADGTNLVIPGLWGMQFGNGLLNQPTNTLFFAAGPNDEADGVYGGVTANSP